jgi:hypothetical protein
VIALGDAGVELLLAMQCCRVWYNIEGMEGPKLAALMSAMWCPGGWRLTMEIDNCSVFHGTKS